MRITLLIKVYNKSLIMESFKMLTKQSIASNLEIVCINESFENISTTSSYYKNKFHSIQIIDKPVNTSNLYQELLRKSTGEYVLLTDSNNLFYDNYNDTDLLERLYNIATDNDTDLLLYNLLNYNDNNNPKNYVYLDSYINQVINTNKLGMDEILEIIDLDCDILFFNIFKIITMLQFDDTFNYDLLKYQYIKDSEKLMILNDFSKDKQYSEDLILNQENKVDLISQINSIKNNIIEFSDNHTIQPEISIIIPAYNPLRKDIVKALNSIFYQTFDFNKLEVIFVDDSSNYIDGINLIKRYTTKYQNIHIYETSENRGAGIARNIGLDNAQGKYIMFLDHDDYYLPEACQMLYDIIDKKNVDMVSGNFIKNNKPIKWENINDNIPLSTIDEKSNIFKIAPSIWTKIYRKTLLDQNNIRFKDYKVSEDKIFQYNVLFSDSTLIYVNEPVVVYEQRKKTDNDEGSKTLQYNLENLLTINNSFMDIYKLYQKHAPEYIHIILNDVNYLTNQVLANTNLSNHDFRIFIQEASYFYKRYIENPKTNTYKNMTLIEYISEDDYVNAYREYINMDR